jgi:DNA-binding transcriptional MerR regulator
MRIGELARRSGTTTKSIRYYESIGLLAPPGRTASGYREYEQDTLDRLAFIKSSQALGLTLGEIRGIVRLREEGETPCEHVLGLIRLRADAITERIAGLERLRAELQRLLERGEGLDPRDCLPSSVCHIIRSTNRE